MTGTLTQHANRCDTQVSHCAQEASTYRPNFDIQEVTDELILYGDLPGVLPDDLDIQFEKGELTVRGKVTARDERTKSLNREYGVGDFTRTFSVAETIDVDAISAELKNGVLTLHLPKSEAVKPRRIKIQS